MCVTSQHRFRSTLFCRCLRDATLWRPINAFDEYFMELKARSCRFKCSAQRVCVSWFGNVTFFDVAVVLTHHNLSSPTPQSHESCEVVLMCVTSQTLVCSDLLCRSLRDATLSRPINASKNTFGIEGEITSSQELFTESLRVMVWYKQALWCCSGFDMPQVICTYYLRPTRSRMKAVRWYSCA